MINKNKILAFIPAREGSKGIVNKNIVTIFNKPLISYSISSALESKYIDSVVVSSDSKEICNISKKYGARVPFLRPKKFATDTSKTIEAVMHGLSALHNLGERYDILVLLQPTLPLRTSIDIDQSLQLFVNSNKKSVVSVCECDNHPLHLRTITKNSKLIPLMKCRSDIRRQDMKKYYVINGAIYINLINKITDKTSFCDNEIAYIMPKLRSIDIDNKFDLKIVEIIMQSTNYR